MLLSWLVHNAKQYTYVGLNHKLIFLNCLEV